LSEKRGLASNIDRSEMYWALGMGSRGGLLIAGPVLLGLVGGWFLDNRLGTLPWITLGLTLVGAVVGPFLAYRWITDAVHRRVREREDRAPEGEDT
jgi:F0F1-type ATP synthase assembly protein I